MPPFRDITGMKFGRLTAVAPTSERCHGVVVWLFQCDCGNTTLITGASATTGNTRSCGCLQRELNMARFPKYRNRHGTLDGHGHTREHARTPTYETWRAMKLRCLNAGHMHYKYYGGRGISVCERWLKFDNFLTDMGERPEGKSLDRINANGNYEPTNCRWATRSEQRRNRRPKLAA